MNASYAAEAKAIATACIEARKHLQKMDSASPCGPLIGELEALGWKLNAAFEGREKLPPPEALLTYMGSDSPLAAACLEAQGIRPEPTTAASRDADKAGDDAEAAAREADKAASDANAAMKKATQ